MNLQPVFQQHCLPQFGVALGGEFPLRIGQQPLEEVDPSDELSIEARSLLQRRLARRSDLMAPAAASRPGLAKGSGTLRRQRRI